MSTNTSTYPPSTNTSTSSILPSSVRKHFSSPLFSVKITTSAYPIPCICQIDQICDWFEALANILHWNIRKPQLSLDADQEDQCDEQVLTENDGKKES